MLVAVSGATGFVGRYIVNRLLAAGHACRCWYRPTSDRGGFDEGGAAPLEWIEGELGDDAATAALIQGVEAVVHAGLWRPTPGRYWSSAKVDLLRFLETNLMGSLRLMHAARRAGVGPFIHISTAAVHDVVLNDRPLDETHPLWPKGHHGAHKAALEKFVHSYGLGDGWPICALRPSGVYGLRRPVEASKWFDIVTKVVRGQPIASNRRGKEVHAADVAKAVEVLLNAPKYAVTGQCFNCSDLFVADEDVAQIAKELTGSPSTIAKLSPGPKNRIETAKIKALGMTFGGPALLRDTVGQLVEVVSRPGNPAADTPPGGSRASAR